MLLKKNNVNSNRFVSNSLPFLCRRRRLSVLQEFSLPACDLRVVGELDVEAASSRQVAIPRLRDRRYWDKLTHYRLLSPES